MAISLKDVGNAVLAFAPTLAGILGGPMAATGVAELSTAIFGHPNAKADEISAALAKGLTPDQIVAIKQSDDAFKQKLVDAGVDVEKIAASDRANARDREVKSGDRATPRTLAALVLSGYFFVQWFILYHIVPAESRDLVMRSLGTLDAAVGLVLGYYFGSSSSTTEHNALMQKALDK